MLEVPADISLHYLSNACCFIDSLRSSEYSFSFVVMLFNLGKLSPLRRRALSMALAAKLTKVPFSHASWLSSKGCCLNTKISFGLKGFHTSSYLSALHLTGSPRLMQTVKEEARSVDLKNVKHAALGSEFRWYIEDKEGKWAVEDNLSLKEDSLSREVMRKITSEVPNIKVHNINMGTGHLFVQEENAVTLTRSGGAKLLPNPYFQTIQNLIERANKIGLKIVCFALDDDSCFIKWDNGKCFWKNLPFCLHQLLHGTKNMRLMPVEFISLGSARRWFVRFQNGRYMISDNVNKCTEMLSHLEQVGGQPQQVLFGEDSSEFFILYEPGPLNGKVAEPRVE